MDVTILESTQRPERLACITARGDYYTGFVGGTEFEELMEPVEYDDRHYDAATERLQSGRYPADWEENRVIEAKKEAMLERLFKRGHFGPFEHPQVTFGIEGVSRSCMAQITRHRHASFDVQSMRYADFSEKDPIVPESLVSDDHFTRDEGRVDVDAREDWREKYEDVGGDLITLYEQMVDSGVPKEDARFILPIGMPVNMSMSMNARALMHVLDMRKKPDAQWEVREMSDRMFDLFRNWMPITAALYDESAPHKLKP